MKILVAGGRGWVERWEAMRDFWVARKDSEMGQGPVLFWFSLESRDG